MENTYNRTKTGQRSMLMLLLMLTFWHLTWTKSSSPIPVLVITESKPAPPPPPATFINNNQNQNSAGILALNWLQSSETKSALYNTFSYLHNVLSHWLYTNRSSLAWFMIIGTIWYFYHLHTQADYLMRTPTWSNWCLDHDPHTITTDHLLIEIHQHHLTTTTISNSTLLFADFLCAIEEEKKKLQKAQWLESLLKKLYVAKLWRSNYDITRIIEDLTTLRNRFIDWYAHQIITKGLYGT